ncbi:MAG: DNA primase [Acidimicrobiia bacterium]|nr:DNA primase [Acidimicrobiia bacterium]
MGLYPQSFIDELRLQANILQVVQEYVPLRKAGTNSWKGLCPFHSEKTPSFHVVPDRQFFKCHGCGKGGDVFKFLELHERLTFTEAVRFLAQKFGVALPETTNEDDSRRDAGARESLLKMHEVASAYFREQLEGPAGARARQLIADRGINPSTAQQLGLGFAPPSREGLKARLLKQGFALPAVLQSGLVVQREAQAPASGSSHGTGSAHGEGVDRFRNRLMIPICRDTGSIIAFGGRAMESDQVPKYLNSPETPIYSKGRILYGLHLTKQAIRKLGYVVLVEGYFDFAQVFQSQAAPVVASCGTALTPYQAELLRRFTTKVVLSYDPDAAGEGAAAKSSELLVKEGFDVNVLVLDRGQDPDTFIQRNGGAAYQARLKASRPYLDYLMDAATRGVKMQDANAQRAFLGKMLAIAAWLPEATARDQFADKVAHRASITAEVVQSEFRKLAAKRQTSLTRAELPGLGEIKPAERALIWWLIQRPIEALPAVVALEEDDLRLLVTRPVLQLAQSLQNLPPEGVPSALIQRLNEQDAELVTGIASEEVAPAKSLEECVSAVRRLRIDHELAGVQRAIQQLLQGAYWNDDDLNALLRKKEELSRQKRSLNDDLWQDVGLR